MIHLITGAMKAGKTKSLIEYTEILKDKKYKVFYPASCNKSEGFVYTRDGDRKFKATKIFEVNDLYNYICDLECIIIDEFTFLCNEYQIDDFMNLLEFCDKNNKDIYLFGITTDYLGRSFELARRVLPYCDSVLVLKSICDECGSLEGTRCVRIINGEIDASYDSDLIVMEGENVEYKSVCKKCFRELTGLDAIK